jgi:hypothetical protein
MSFGTGVITTIVFIFFVLMIFVFGLNQGRESVALQLQACLEVASSPDICENQILDKHLPKKGN